MPGVVIFFSAVKLVNAPAPWALTVPVTLWCGISELFPFLKAWMVWPDVCLSLSRSAAHNHKHSVTETAFNAHCSATLLFHMYVQNLLSRTVAMLCVFCWRLLCHWLRTTQLTPPKLNSRAVSRGFSRENCPALERRDRLRLLETHSGETKKPQILPKTKTPVITAVMRVHQEATGWVRREVSELKLQSMKQFSYLLCMSRIDWRRMLALFCTRSKSRAMRHSEERKDHYHYLATQ